MRSTGLVAAGTLLVASTYGLVRLAYGLLLPEVDRELGLGAGLGGLVSAGASLAYCLGAAVGFVLAPRRPRPVVVLATLTAGVGAVGMALAWSGPGFGVFAVLGSTGAGAASPALVTIAQRGVRAAEVERAQSSINAGTGPGLVAAGLLALLVLPQWRSAWWVAALVTVLAGLAVLALDRPSRRPGPVTSSPLPPWDWYRRHRVPLLAALLLGTGSAVVWTFGRSHLVDSGLGETASLLAWVVLGLGGTAAIATAGWLARLRPPAAWAVTVAVVAVGTASIATSAGRPVLAALGCLLFGWGFVAATSALIAWAGWLDPDRAAAGTSLLFIALVVGQSLGAAAGGALAEQVGLAGSLLGGAAACVVAAVLPLPRVEISNSGMRLT